MVDSTIIFFVSGIVIIILFLINVVLLWLFWRTHKRLDSLLDAGKIKSFKDIFLAQKEKNAGLEEEIKQAFAKIKDLEDIAKITIQKTGVIRFNPFNELGGNQSFVIALLDAENTGFVISSLFVKEGNRVYAKAIKKGKSEHLLSEEEKKAIEKACLAGRQAIKK